MISQLYFESADGWLEYYFSSVECGGSWTFWALNSWEYLPVAAHKDSNLDVCVESCVCWLPESSKLDFSSIWCCRGKVWGQAEFFPL